MGMFGHFNGCVVTLFLVSNLSYLFFVVSMSQGVLVRYLFSAILLMSVGKPHDLCETH